MWLEFIQFCKELCHCAIRADSYYLWSLINPMGSWWEIMIHVIKYYLIDWKCWKIDIIIMLIIRLSKVPSGDIGSASLCLTGNAANTLSVGCCILASFWPPTIGSWIIKEFVCYTLKFAYFLLSKQTDLSSIHYNLATKCLVFDWKSPQK